MGVITARIESCIRDSDTLARCGADEFAILLEATGTEAATALLGRISEAVADEVPFQSRAIYPSLNVGIATGQPGATTDDLIRRADIAMYAAKRAGTGRAEVFHETMAEIPGDVLDLQSA